MRQFARPDAEGQRAQPAMGAGMAVAAHDQAPGKAKAKFGSDDVDDALTGLVDVEHPDAASGGFGPQAGQQFLSDLAGAGPAARRRDRMVRRRKRQFRIMDRKTPTLEVEQAARAAEIMQQMTIDVQKIGIIADMGNDVLVPDFGQQRAAGLVQWPVLLLASLAGGISR